MSEMTDTRERLRAALGKVRRSIKRVRDRKDRVGEQNTKSVLIEPVLAALGWDLTDLDEVFLEYRHKPQDNPVDYALLLQRSPRLFVEAKELDTNLDDHKWKSQIISYASVAGVEWCVLTDGDTYCIYNAYAPVDVEQKLFRRVSVSDAAQDDATVETLELLSKEKLTENSINVLWKAHFIDRQVQSALEEMFEGQDASLVRLLKKRTTNLKPSEIRESLKRADIAVEFPALAAPPGHERVPAEETRATETPDSEWGPRSYSGPLLLDGTTVVLNKYRPLLKTTRSERVSLDTIRRAAQAARALGEGGAVINVDAICACSGGPKARGAATRALGALCIASALVFTGQRQPDSFKVAHNLSPEGMVQRVLFKAQPLEPGPTAASEVAHAPTGGGVAKQVFKWLLTMHEDGGFVIDCRYLPDQTKNFQVRGRRAPADEDFKPARGKLFEDIYEQIKPLFPDLPDGRVRAKAWSGVHKVYPASAYGKK